MATSRVDPPRAATAATRDSCADSIAGSQAAGESAPRPRRPELVARLGCPGRGPEPLEPRERRPELDPRVRAPAIAVQPSAVGERVAPARTAWAGGRPRPVLRRTQCRRRQTAFRHSGRASPGGTPSPGPAPGNRTRSARTEPHRCAPSARRPRRGRPSTARGRARRGRADPRSASRVEVVGRLRHPLQTQLKEAEGAEAK